MSYLCRFLWHSPLCYSTTSKISKWFHWLLYHLLHYNVKKFWIDQFLPALPKAEAGLGIAFSVRTSKAILLSVISNSNSFQSILFKLCTVFVYILKMCTSYYRLIWRFYSYIICMLNLVIFYHYMSWTVPSWCNLNLQQCSINIIQTLYSVCIHIEDMHLLLWADLTIFFFNFLYVENHYMTLMVPSWCNLKL